MFEPHLFDRSRVTPRALAVVAAVEGAEPGAPRTSQSGEDTLNEARALGLALKVLSVAVGERLLEIAERELSPLEGRASAVSWAVGELNMAPGDAKRLLEAARACQRLPRLAEHYRTGWLTASHVLTAVEAMDGFSEEQVQKGDEILADAGRWLTLKEFAAVCQDMRETVVPDLVAEELDRLPEASRLTVAPVPGGVRLSGVAYGADGETIRALVNRMSVRLPDDDRTAAKRRMDGLATLCRIGAGLPLAEADLDGTPYQPADLPPVQIEVIVDVVALRRALERERAEEDARVAEDFRRLLDPGARPGAASWTPRCEHELVRSARGALTGVPIGWRELVTEFCDAAVHRMVLEPPAEVLELGKEVRLFSRAQRRALRRGSLRCQWPRCDSPWVEADHVTRHADGGATDCSNGRLLCRFHHRLRHRGWRLEVDPNGGRELCAVPPPDWAHQLAQTRRRTRPHVA